MICAMIGSTVTVGSGLHLSSCVSGRNSLSLRAGFFLVSAAFSHQMVKGWHCCRARPGALRFHGADRTQAILEGIPAGAPNSVQT